MFPLLLLVLLISYGESANAIRTSKAVQFVMGGSQITFSLAGISSQTIENMKCVVRFPDGSDPIEFQPAVPRDRQSAICRLPPEIDSGSVDIDLAVTITTISTEILTENLLINPSALGEVQVEENWNTNELSFIWSPEYFAQFFEPNANVLIQLTVYVADGHTDPTFTATQIMQHVGFNSGSGRVTVSAPNLQRFSDIQYPYFYVLKAVGTDTSVYLSSVLFAPVQGMDDSLASETCSDWYQFATVPREILPCPASLRQVEIDANFVQTDYNPQIVQLANGALNNHVLYYQRVSTKAGHAQTCSYNSLNNNLAGTSPAQAAWIHSVSKFDSYVDNYFSDIWPYIVCCLQSNSKEYCDMFHEKRPVDSGHEYEGPENPCKGTGDPHMVTFDSVKYDFMGYGEFWLIRGPEGSEFGVQGRMSPNSLGQKVSFYKAVAAMDGNTTVQVQLKSGNLQVYLNRVELRLSTFPITIPADNAFLTIKQNRVDIRFQTGFTIIVEKVGNLYFNVYGSGAHTNKGKGFMGIFGNFDNNPENDLTAQDGYVIPPTKQNLLNLSLLHNRFGMTWKVTAEESYFVYEAGKSWEDHSNVGFTPIAEYPDPETLPAEVRAICGDSLFCYYEYVGTDSLEQASEIVRWENEFDDLREEIERVEILCQTLPPPPNGRVQVEGHLNGSLATYSCNREFDFISAQRTRTCSISQDISQWIGAEPICIWTCTTCQDNMEFELTHDPNDCTKFFLCSFGERFSLDCPVLNNFNPETLLCTIDHICHDPPGC